MQRFHVNLTVKDLDSSIAFYSALFASEPTLKHDDYAKWMLDDPRINFAISTHGNKKGINHVGLQADTEEELSEIRERLTKADRPVLEQDETTCCYANSKKAWIQDPDGVAWETFVTHGQNTTYGDGSIKDKAQLYSDGKSEETSACCIPEKIEEQPGSGCC